MGQKVFLFEQQYCMGCQACVVSCNARHGLMPGVYPRKADSFQVKCAGPYLSMACNHCDNPACAAVCPVGAINKRDDGIVVHDSEVCIGCYSCVQACPYGAPQPNEINGKMVKCDMCAARLDRGDDPACVLACPMKVIKVVEVEEAMERGAVPEGVGFEDLGTGPNLWMLPMDA